MMSDDGEDTGWMCGRAGMVNLHRVSSIVREIGEPCRYHSSAKRNKMLKPEKWQSNFDSDGKIIGFQKALKLIVVGGVDASIRAEVWEFLLGCYALSSTAECRRQLRKARRERYADLIKQCQRMHSSIGTGNLAYVVGSRVMDVRTLSKDNVNGKAVTTSEYASHDAADKLDSYPDMDIDTTYLYQKKSSDNSTDLASARMSTDSAAFNYGSRNSESEINELQYDSESLFDFPPLPVTNLFKKNGDDKRESKKHGDSTSVSEGTAALKVQHMYSFQINNNVDPTTESDFPSASDNVSYFSSDSQKCVEGTKARILEKDVVNALRISDIPEAAMIDKTTTNGLVTKEDRVSEWLWTLHRIVVDVVRTDSHLEFYGDPKNMARMSDILAVYAWVDPATGYCQGMSDLLSPFVVLYEDNADAFWCFEMLLRRMMMWAADFDESLCQRLETICLKPLFVQLRESSSGQMRSDETECSKKKHKARSRCSSGESFPQYSNGTRPISIRPFCGLSSANCWTENDQLQPCSMFASTRNSSDGLPVFCAAAILIINRQKIMRETHSIDDMFNDNKLKINVRRCIRMAIKVRKNMTFCGSYIVELELEALSNISKIQLKCIMPRCTSIFFIQKFAFFAKNIAVNTAHGSVVVLDVNPPPS
ncbi:TBC domain containing protein [Musa troglodytarum]|uniref:TBC domain containing protein n=1 Tax=Musa troglodytarum TaxID=320322 RepID=A0A9E7KUI7_9LILI|nr:TBC domain containing protein [Musa troglodytarum]